MIGFRVIEGLRTHGNEEKSEKPVVEESYAPKKREPAANAHNVGKKANDAVLGLDALKVMLLNYIEQLSIAVIHK